MSYSKSMTTPYHTLQPCLYTGYAVFPPLPQRKKMFGDNTLFRSLRQSCWESKPPKVRRKTTKERAILSNRGDNSNNCSRHLKGYPNRTKQVPCTAKKKRAHYLKSVKIPARASICSKDVDYANGMAFLPAVVPSPFSFSGGWGQKTTAEAFNDSPQSARVAARTHTISTHQASV